MIHWHLGRITVDRQSSIKNRDTNFVVDFIDDTFVKLQCVGGLYEELAEPVGDVHVPKNLPKFFPLQRKKSGKEKLHIKKNI